MKKTVRIVALVTLVVVAMMALVACATPNDNYADAREALEEKDYKVTVADSDIALSIYKLGNLDDLKTVVYAVKSGDEDKDEDDQYITIYYFESEVDAEDGVKVLEEKHKKDIDDKKVVVGQKGKIAWVGTKQAVKDSSGSFLAF